MDIQLSGHYVDSTRGWMLEQLEALLKMTHVIMNFIIYYMIGSSILGASSFFNFFIQHLSLKSIIWSEIWRAFPALDPNNTYSWR